MRDSVRRACSLHLSRQLRVAGPLLEDRIHERALLIRRRVIARSLDRGVLLRAEERVATLDPGEVDF
jgi:hypothetical protein